VALAIGPSGDVLKRATLKNRAGAAPTLPVLPGKGEFLSPTIFPKESGRPSKPFVHDVIFIEGVFAQGQL